MTLLSKISQSIISAKNNAINFSIKQKSPLLATLSCTSYMASNFMPPPARSICLTVSALAGALSVGSLASDLTEKVTGTLNKNLEEVNKTGADVVNAMGGNILTPIELKSITTDDKQKMSETKPIMDNTTKTAWDRITKWVSLSKKPTFNKRQSNYDCLYMYGPPGTGKTVFANALFGAVDNKYDFKLANITAGDLMERGAEKLNHLKKEVLGLIDNAKDANKPICIGFFLDEVEGSLSKDRSLNAGVVNEYLTFINEIKDAAAHNPNVYILGALATNYDEQVDRASKRDGRVTETLHIDYPTLDVKKRVLDMVVDKLDSTPYTNKIKEDIKTAIKTALDDDNSAIKTALDEEHLVGAAIENAVIKTQKDIALNNITKDIPNEFIKRLSNNITTATATATKQREADEKELKARQSLSVQLSGMREALETISKKDSSGNIADIAKHLKEISEKTGNNEQLEKIMTDMGEKFKEMQTASTEDRKKMIQQISEFIKQVQEHSKNASNSAINAQKSENHAHEYSKNAQTEYRAWSHANGTLSNLQDALTALTNKVTYHDTFLCRDS